MLIGDHVGLKLQFTGPANAQVFWPFIPDTILGNIQVIGRGKIDSVAGKKAGDPLQLTQEFNITCYDSGFYTIPGIDFKYRVPPDTSLLTLNSSLLTLMVHTLKVDTTQAIKPIKGPLQVPITLREMIPWILLALGVIILILGLIWYLKKRKKNEPIFQLKPRVKLQPYELALQELEKLRTKKLWQQGKVKEYHTELTDVLRKYIEERFFVPALESTTFEIVEGLTEKGNCQKASVDKLNELLVRADMVKFAKGLPTVSENDQSLSGAIEFVNETTGADGGGLLRPSASQ